METGVLETVKWTFDNGTLTFKPVNGKEGTCEEHLAHHIKKFAKTTKTVNTKGLLHFSKQSLEFLFQDFVLLETADLSAFETSQVSNMQGVFVNCDKLTNIDLSSFNTSNVVNMASMFEDCYSLKELDLSHFDMSNVTNVAYMFSFCRELTNVRFGNCPASNISYAVCMFRNCEKLKTLKLPRFYFEAMFPAMMFRGCINLSKIDFRGVKGIKATDFSLLGIPFGCHFVVEKEVEEQAKKAVPLIAFYYLYDGKCELGKEYVRFRIAKIYDLLEKIGGLDFNQERKLLMEVFGTYSATGYKALEFLQNGLYPNTKKMVDVVKIMKSHEYKMTLFSKSVPNIIKLLKRDGILSDIDAYLSGVPLDDILA